jgi:aminoglycoside phosphotransferase (APT) family kinase protein
MPVWCCILTGGLAVDQCSVLRETGCTSNCLHVLDPARARRIVNAVADDLGVLAHDFRKAPNGTIHAVYLSDGIVLRLRERLGPLRREAAWLQSLEGARFPRVLWTRRVGSVEVAAVQRLPGAPLSGVWPRMTQVDKGRVVADCVTMLRTLRRHHARDCYSVETGRRYRTGFAMLSAGLTNDLQRLRSDPVIAPVALQLAHVVRRGRAITAGTGTAYRFHGDLIVQNLLSDGHRLTGVVDWERAGTSPLPIDLFRLRYYSECASAYVGTEPSGAVEAEFLDRLFAALWNTDLIPDATHFLRQYRVARARYRLRAMAWEVAAGADAVDVLAAGGIAPAT